MVHAKNRQLWDIIVLIKFLFQAGYSRIIQICRILFSVRKICSLCTALDGFNGPFSSSYQNWNWNTKVDIFGNSSLSPHTSLSHTPLSHPITLSLPLLSLSPHYSLSPTPLTFTPYLSLPLLSLSPHTSVSHSSL